MSLFPAIEKLAKQAIQTAKQLPTDRIEILDPFVSRITESIAQNAPAHVNFICTHNSRRSHLSHVWAQVAAYHFGIDQAIKTYSGGTEATACNERTIAAFQRAGFVVETTDCSDNPRYSLGFASDESPIIVFSKVYHDTSVGNPDENYIAGMCCDDVDQKCPVVQGATARIPLYYVDPKIADDTAQESEVYDERSNQIASEMFYVMRSVSQRIAT